MDRNNMRSTYINSGPRSLPHMGGSKRHSTNGHSARLSPPAHPAHSAHPPRPVSPNHTHHDDLIHYIYESWSKVTRDMERGTNDAKYYREVMAPRQLANFRPFNLEEWWSRRLIQTVNRTKHRS